jgi:hypothetical protein
MKWLLALITLTVFFFIYSFSIHPSFVLAFRWMTMGMAIVSFLFYFMIVRNSKKENSTMLGSNIAAIVLKFMLSALVIISYAFIFRLKSNIEFIYFFIAYFAYSIVMYVGAYQYK